MKRTRVFFSFEERRNTMSSERSVSSVFDSLLPVHVKCTRKLTGDETSAPEEGEEGRGRAASEETTAPFEIARERSEK